MVRRNRIPLDYSLCRMTVTVYGEKGSRRVLRDVHHEHTREKTTAMGAEDKVTDFLLVIPGEDPIAPGDKVLPGIGPEEISWEELNAPAFPGLGVVRTVKPRYFLGKPCHTEARG